MTYFFILFVYTIYPIIEITNKQVVIQQTGAFLQEGDVLFLLNKGQDWNKEKLNNLSKCDGRLGCKNLTSLDDKCKNKDEMNLNPLLK